MKRIDAAGRLSVSQTEWGMRARDLRHVEQQP